MKIESTPSRFSVNWKAILTGLSLLILLTALVAAVLFLAGPRKPPQSVTLADGTRLSLRGVTYKSPHEVAFGTDWRDKLYRVVPLGVSRKLGARVNTQFTGRTNSIVVWLQSGDVPRASGGGTLPGGFLSSNFRAVAVDENGIESSEIYVSYQKNGGVVPVELRNAPRRSREITLRIYDSTPTGQLTLAGDFKIENRFPITTPGWTPESLPATRKTNGLTITLLEFETGRIGWGDRPTSMDKGRRNSRAFFDIRENGQHATNWNIAKLHFDSAASGPFDPNSYSSGSSLDRFSFTGEAALWPEEPAWKIVAEAWRRSDFPAEELWVVTNIAVPDAGQVTEVNAKTNIYGAPAELLGIITSGAATPKGWISGMGMGNGAPVLRVDLDAHPADVHLTLVEIRDDQGRKVNQQGSGYSGDGTNKMHHSFGLKFPDGAKAINVTLAISKSRTVEFLVKPSFTNAPAK